VQFLKNPVRHFDSGLQLSLGAYVEEVQLVGLDADAVGEQEDVALLPGNFLGRGIRGQLRGQTC
jgi:hypothetical protein